MNNKQKALLELYEGLLEKFGSDAETKSIIKSHISNIKTKSKISVSDLETLESSIKSHRSSKNSNFSSQASNTHQHALQKSPNPLFQSSQDDFHDILKSYRSTSFKAGKKKISRNPDNALFPSESPTNPEKSSEIWRLYRSISPNHNKNHFDVWGQIHKADYLKFVKEERDKSRLKKRNQKEYKDFLDQQVRDSAKFKEIKPLQCSLVLPSEISEFKKSTWKQDLDQLVARKIEKNLLQINQNIQEDSLFLEKLKNEEKEENFKKNERKKKFKIISKDLLSECLSKKSEIQKKMMGSRNKSRELMAIRLENMEKIENLQRDQVKNRVNWVQDEKRLRKLMPLAKTPSSSFSGNNSLVIPERSKLKVVEELDNQKSILLQIKEKELQQHQDFKEKMKEARIAKISEFQALKEFENNESQKRENQKIMKNELESQMAQKQKRKVDELLFTEHEARLNRRIFESSLELLMKNK
jgi:hypothetical protein